jgi:hypothetical protein
VYKHLRPIERIVFMDTSLPHVFDYHGIKVRVVICNGLVCVDPQDTLKCLGLNDTGIPSKPEEMIAKLASMKGTHKGLAFAHWIHKVVLPTMQKNL